jgi:hypothetical protein
MRLRNDESNDGYLIRMLYTASCCDGIVATFVECTDLESEDLSRKAAIFGPASYDRRARRAG